MSTDPRESGLEFESKLASLQGIDMLDEIRVVTNDIGSNDPDYEAALRNGIVLNEKKLPQGAPTEDDSSLFVMDELGDLLRESLGQQRLPRSEFLAPALFVWFEWHNRNDSDKEKCIGQWREMFGLVDENSEDAKIVSGESIYQYAKSRWLHQDKKLEEALVAARKANAASPMHPGFLNNYGEILVDRYKECLFDEECDDAIINGLMREAQDVASKFERIAEYLRGAGDLEKYWRPSFTVTREMLSACGSHEGLVDDDGEFDKARERLRFLHESGDGVFGNEARFITEMGDISNKQSLFYLIGNFKRMHVIIDEQRRSSQRIEEEMKELEGKVTDNRISVIETLGFFSAIIALIITSVQAGEGLSFGLRALFVLVLLGALLIAFGSLDIIIAPYKSDFPPDDGKGFWSRIPNRAKMLWLIGAFVIVIGCALSFLPYPDSLSMMSNVE